MALNTLKKKEQRISDEPLSLDDVFYNAVHNDNYAPERRVIQRGPLSDGTKYQIVLLNGGNVDSAMLEKMMALQDEVAEHKMPHPINVIDYKTKDEVTAHFKNGGLGLGVFTEDNKLIGQTLLSFKQPATGILAKSDKNTQAHIGWLMVNRDGRGSNLCSSLLSRASDIAEQSGMSQIVAQVRVHNARGVEKFALEKFVVTESV